MCNLSSPEQITPVRGPIGSNGPIGLRLVILWLYVLFVAKIISFERPSASLQPRKIVSEQIQTKLIKKY
jgi:hypothetical protein